MKAVPFTQGGFFFIMATGIMQYMELVDYF